jgi:hypothetical protein
VAIGNSRDSPTRFLFCCPRKEWGCTFSARVMGKLDIHVISSRYQTRSHSCKRNSFYSVGKQVVVRASPVSNTRYPRARAWLGSAPVHSWIYWWKVVRDQDCVGTSPESCARWWLECQNNLFISKMSSKGRLCHPTDLQIPLDNYL